MISRQITAQTHDEVKVSCLSSLQEHYHVYKSREYLARLEANIAMMSIAQQSGTSVEPSAIYYMYHGRYYGLRMLYSKEMPCILAQFPTPNPRGAKDEALLKLHRSLDPVILLP